MKKTFRILLFGLFVVTLLAWPTLLWVESFYEFPQNYSLIEEGLWMGGDTDEPPPETYAVLNLCQKPDPYECEVHVWEYIKDGAPAPNIDWLRKKVEWVEKYHSAGQVTYVHCFSGKSRSTLVITAYLMHKYDLTRDEALEKVREKRPGIIPNKAFLKLLSEWENR